MNAIDAYKVAAAVAVTGVVSWLVSCETLFILGILLTLALAAVVGAFVGLMSLTERMSAEFVREKQDWRTVRAGAPVSHR